MKLCDKITEAEMIGRRLLFTGVVYVPICWLDGGDRLLEGDDRHLCDLSIKSSTTRSDSSTR